MDDEKNQQFFLDHLWRPASKVFHLERGLQIIQAHSEPPATRVSSNDFFGRILGWIKQGGDQRYVFCAESPLLDPRSQDANGHFPGKAKPFSQRKESTGSGRLLPDKQAFAVSETFFGSAEIDPAQARWDAANHIQPQRLQPDQHGKNSIGAVGDDNISFDETSS